MRCTARSAEEERDRAQRGRGASCDRPLVQLL